MLFRSQRVLQEQTVDAERKKLLAGVSTSYNVILTERDLVTAESITSSLNATW